MAALHTNEFSFVKAPPDDIEIECPICLQVMLDDPHLVSCCGHHFCGPCIKRVKYSNQPCPYCKEKGYQAVPDKSRLRYINGLQVNCANKGCGWKGELRSLSSHINAEKREGACQFEVVECIHDECNAKQQRRHLKIHEEEKCHQRPYDCQYCRHKGTYQYIIQQHYPQCTRYPVPCPRKCSRNGRIPRGDIQCHLSTLCPLQPVECEFKWAGCHYSPLRKDLRQHSIQSQSNHMSLLVKSYKEVEMVCESLEKENRGLKVVCQELKKDNGELKKDNGELKKDNGELKRDNGELKVLCQELKRDNGKLNRDNGELKKDNGELKRDNGELKVLCQELKRDNGKLNRDNGELKIICQELMKDNGKLQSDNGELKRDNGELKVLCQELMKDNGKSQSDNGELKRDNGELKRENDDIKQQLVNVHHAIVDDHHPLLPVTVSWLNIGKGVRYFYSKPCGHLMSVEVGFPITIKVYKGKFQLPVVLEIVIEYQDDKVLTKTTITKIDCLSYRDSFDERSNIIQEFKFNYSFKNEFDIVCIN